MVLYTANVPQATQTIAFTQPLIQANFQYLPQVLGVDHEVSSLDSATADEGYHKIIHMKPMSSPTVIPGYTQVYTRTIGGNTQLYVLNGSDQRSRLTGHLNAQDGYQYIGGVLIQWGRRDVPSANATGIVTMPNTFSGVGYTVYVSFIANTGGSSSSNSTVSVINGSLTSSQFEYNWRTSNNGAYTGFYWFAIGAASV